MSLARERWKASQASLDPTKLVFVDETGANTKMVRVYGRCRRGQRLVCKTPWGHWKTTTFTCGLRCDGLVAPWVLEGPMTGDAFLIYVEKVLVPTLSRGDTVIIDNLSSHNSKSTQAWLEDHPRIRHVFIPKGACWLNLQEGWWRIFRRQALAGQSFADPDEIAHATRVATAQLNARAQPWIWGRPEPQNRPHRRRFIYTL